MLSLNNIQKVFNVGTVDENKLFCDFSLSVEDGEFVAIVGSNGSGKTTLLNMICGTSRPDSGSIVFNGSDITSLPEYKRARRIGRVLQDPKWVPARALPFSKILRSRTTKTVDTAYRAL